MSTSSSSPVDRSADRPAERPAESPAKNNEGASAPAESSMGANYPAESSAGTNGPAGSSAGISGPAENSTGTNYPAENSTGTNYPAGSSAGTNYPAGSSAGTNGPAENSTGTNYPAGSSAGTNGPAENSTGTNYPAESSAGTNGPAENSTGANGPAENSTSAPAENSTGTSRPADSSASASAPTKSSTGTNYPAKNSAGHRLAARGLTLAYEDRTVVEDLDLGIPDGEITVVVGPNACGKSTTLRALGRLLKPRGGAVLLDGEELARIPTRKIAQSIGLLPQSPVAPEAITVADLVSRGRQPHQRWWQQWSEEDERAVTDAMDRTDVTVLGDRPVDELSGGQRQRVWIAMALAQETDLLLLDEPTTYLDIAHQVEVLDLVRQLNQDQGRTVVMVLHDLNQAARYADHLVAMKEGRLVARGRPADIVDADLVREVFGLESVVVPCPVTGDPLVVPGLPRRSAAAGVPAPTDAPEATTTSGALASGSVTSGSVTSGSVTSGKATS